MALGERPDARRHQGRLSVPLVLTGLILLALDLRFWSLGDGNFEATEMFTLRTGCDPGGEPRPLIYLLIAYLVGPFRPLDDSATSSLLCSACRPFPR